MSFFQELPDPPRPQHHPQPAWLGPPRGELPLPLALALPVGRSERAAVLLGPLRVYSTGFEIDLVAIVRDPVDFDDPIHIHPRGRKEDLMRLAVVCSDGSSAEVARTHAWDEQGRVLTPRGGGGGSGLWEHRLWSWPLPPPGSVDVVCWWPKHGVAETRTSFDAAPILDAAAKVERLWPDEGAVSGGSIVTQHVFSSDD